MALQIDVVGENAAVEPPQALILLKCAQAGARDGAMSAQTFGGGDLAHMDILALLLSADGEESAIAAAAALPDVGGRRSRALLFEIEPRRHDTPVGCMTPEGHARLHEIVFGGLTRALIGDAAAPPPILMAH
jgi:hypothetical protein